MPSPRQQIQAEAVRLGFDDFGITTPASIPDAGTRLQEFLDQGYYGDMGWMVEKAERRKSPANLWPEAESVIMLAMNYGPASDPLDILETPDRAGISVYAKGQDYHDLVKKRLKALARWMHQEFSCDVKVFVDTAPVMEKPLGEKAGLGWQGKHTNLVSRNLGSWFFLGSIFTTMKLAPNQPESDHCGRCQQCIDICPTHAFPAPYRLDARRCISYLTIEHKGQIPLEFREPMGNRIYGCDDCLAVCPWNKFARTAKESAFHARAELAAPRIEYLLDLDDADFRSVFAGSPVKRTGRDRFIRNVLVAAGNSGDQTLIPQIIALLDDTSPLVRGMAVWALSRLLKSHDFDRLKTERSRDETNPSVRVEWQALRR